ncbi:MULTISPECIES: DMT family transporter [unclassified Frankia]|uniref:DMT family transporter n=1 Tax=unclassified Frankia TaxID=2632575 RepID=UPI002AD3A9B5|nr:MULTISPECIES: DMT family transporter [unclassified Frankia]
MNTLKPSASREKTGAIELTLAMMLSGTLGIFVIESGASPFNVVFFRCVFGAIALGLYCSVHGLFRNHGFTLKKLALAALGGVFIVFNWALLFEAYKSTSISVATVVYHTQPFYVVLLGALLFRDKITAVKCGWFAVAFSGLILVADITPADFTNGTHYLTGIGQALLAAVFYAFATIIAKRLSGVRPQLIALVQVIVGIPLLAPFTNFHQMSGIGTGWAWLVGIGVIHTCLMYILMYSSFQKLPTSKIAVLAFVYPAVAMLGDWAVYGHHVSALQALGIPLIIAASLGINLGWRIGPRRAAAQLVELPLATASAAAPTATAGVNR